LSENASMMQKKHKECWRWELRSQKYILMRDW
jgi:hypothetical protein